MFKSEPIATEAPPYVPEIIEPVIGIASWRSVLVLAISLLKKFLNVVAILLSYPLNFLAEFNWDVYAISCVNASNSDICVDYFIRGCGTVFGIEGFS